MGPMYGTYLAARASARNFARATLLMFFNRFLVLADLRSISIVCNLKSTILAVGSSLNEYSVIDDFFLRICYACIR